MKIPRFASTILRSFTDRSSKNALDLFNSITGRALDKAKSILDSDQEVDPKNMGRALELAINDNSNFVSKILDSNREIDPHILGQTTLSNINKPVLISKIIKTDRAIDPLFLSITLEKTIEAGNKKQAYEIINSSRELEPEKLGHALVKAIKVNDTTSAQAIIDSNKNIDPYMLGKSLEHAINYNPEIAEKIMTSNRKIATETLGGCLYESIIKDNKLIFNKLFYSFDHSERTLGHGLCFAVKNDRDDLAKSILNSKRKIDPLLLEIALKDSQKKGSIIAEYIEDKINKPGVYLR